MQTEPSVTSSTTKRSRLNLAHVPKPRGYICMTLRLDPATWVKWQAFRACVEARVGRRRVDHRALAGAALLEYMRRHKAWEGPGARL